MKPANTRRPRNPVAWLVIGVPVVGITLALITVTLAIVTADAPIEVVDPPLSKTSWQTRPEAAP